MTALKKRIIQVSAAPMLLTLVGSAHTEPIGGPSRFKVWIERNAVVKLISEDAFQACADKWNCASWKSVESGDEIPSGTYRYRAKWLKGPEECDQFTAIQTRPFTIPTYYVKQTGKPCDHRR